jgi:hypothetical protein
VSLTRIAPWNGANLTVAGLDVLLNYTKIDTSIQAIDGVPTVPELSQTFETLVMSEMTFLGPNLGAPKEYFCRPHKPPKRLAFNESQPFTHACDNQALDLCRLSVQYTASMTLLNISQTFHSTQYFQYQAS